MASTEVFTPDAYIDYRKLGGIDGRYPQIKAVARHRARSTSRTTVTWSGNIEITLAGDTATGRTLCINPMDTPLPAGRFAGDVPRACGTTISSFARQRGWRMTERVEEGCFQHNVPAHMAIPAA